ncbi:hypothetical protein BU24DRAFT_116155 [Aaosphaeria arxii CBS 175.79]|uniref:Uncharacterized protein n=1 Tax=Aaosphaeria arxii CBS 175.79 TaxID=1450172 RepID=A0A6A5Y452_9PLEO|nr:uncharacterized protein BU24DRAFT_116155 [Aaosphaeria arxii CBS 175.79]KAF2019294.1 hypothetical protein BU24DRAFT_116155 [Aaosphaeria arxii CBS 175.79]
MSLETASHMWPELRQPNGSISEFSTGCPIHEPQLLSSFSIWSSSFCHAILFILLPISSSINQQPSDMV